MQNLLRQHGFCALAYGAAVSTAVPPIEVGPLWRASPMLPRVRYQAIARIVAVPRMAPRKSSRQTLQTRNRILKGLPRAVFRRLEPYLAPVNPAAGDSIYEPNQRGKHVYFPETGMAAIVTITKDGTETEVASVGCEGMIGLPAFSGARTAPRRAFWQIPGAALRMSAARLRAETRRGGPLARALHLYAHALFTQLAQLATCNRLHTIEQRCCCWLLLTHDRVDGDAFDVTHEGLARLLGARRAGVTVIAGALQEAGLIEYRRGRVTIRNRKGLERRACECYGVVRQEFDRLVG